MDIRIDLRDGGSFSISEYLHALRRRYLSRSDPEFLCGSVQSCVFINMGDADSRAYPCIKEQGSAG